METLTKRYIVIDLKQDIMLPTPQFIQQDSNILEFVVKENGVDVNLSNIGKIIVNYKRPDGKVISRLLTANGNKVTYEIGQSEMEVYGEGLLEIQFYSLDILQRVSTRIFKINLSQSIGTTGISEGDSNITLLQQLMIEVTDLNTQVTNAETVRENSESVRQSQETTRQSMEDGRILAENDRVTAENKRQTDTQIAITNAENATLSANTASTNAETQANYAKTQGDYALEKGNYAKGQGDIALQNASDALNATNDANSATAKANDVANNTRSLGEYSPTTSYKPNNFVRYQGSTYICIKDSTGNLPTDNVYFQLVAQRGLDGTGAISTVNNKLPNENGDVQLTHTDVGAAPASHTHTATDLPNGTTAAKGVVQLSSSTASTSTTLAATPSAVKSAYDKAVSAENIANENSNKIGLLTANYNVYATQKDEINRVYKVIDFKRQDGTLYIKSTLSDLIGDHYETLTWNYYNAIGTTITDTVKWKLTYDDDGFIASKVVQV